MKRLKLFILVAALLLPMVLSVAQGAPDQINDALEALNRELGTSYTLNDIFWTWRQDNYPDGSLGCPESIDNYPAEPTVGYEFTFRVDNVEYDYRVSADRQIVFLCSVTELEAEEGVATPQSVVGEDDDAPYTNPLCPAPPEGITYMQTRLRAGLNAQVMPGLPVRVRAEPNTQAAITGELPPETEFTVVQGPACDEEGYLWWLVDANGFTGYVAEGRDGEYFVQPAPGAPLLGDYPLIAADNAAQVVPVSNLQGNLGDYLAFTPDSAYLVTVGERGSEAAWIYTLADLEAGVRTINAGSTLTDIDFGPEPRLALFGSGNGGVRLWNITLDATLVERAFLLGHDSPVSAVAFAPDGQTFASIGGLAFMRVDDPGNQFGIIVWTLENVAQRAALRGHTAEVTELHYDPADATGTTLVSSSADGTLRFWSVAAQDAETVVDLGTGVMDFAYAPDGTTIAAALVSGEVALVANGAEVLRVLAHDEAVNALAFSSDGSVLVTAGDDGLIKLWNVNALAQTTSALPTPLITLEGHTDVVTDLAISPDGMLLASISADNTLRLWAVVVQAVG